MVATATSAQSEPTPTHRVATNGELNRAPATLREIQRAVAEHFGVTLLDIESRRRSKKEALARVATWWLCRKCTSRTLPQIGRTFDRDHTTIASGCNRIEALMAKDAAFDAEMRALLMALLPAEFRS